MKSQPLSSSDPGNEPWQRNGERLIWLLLGLAVELLIPRESSVLSLLIFSPSLALICLGKKPADLRKPWQVLLVMTPLTHA